MYVDQEPVRGWLAEREHGILGAVYAERLHALLEGFPWAGSRISWAEVPHARIEMPVRPGPDFVQECRGMPATGHEYLLVTYSASQSAILCRTADALIGMDDLYLSAPGPRYFCGAAMECGEVRIFPDDFAEYDISGLTFRLHAQWQG
jgi:hypothetical protein